MIKTRILSVAFSAILVTTLLAGCAGKPFDNGGLTDEAAHVSGSTETETLTPDAVYDSISVVDVVAGDLLEPSRGVHSPSARTAALGANDFAFRLSAALAQEAGTDNFICSPFSVWLPLAALVNAADDQYKSSLLEALGAAGLSEENINTAASRMLYDLTQQRTLQYVSEFTEYYNPLKIANAVFVDMSYTLRQDFAQTFMDCYRGAAINVDFGSESAVRSVNQWAADNTEGLISEIINEFDPDTVAVLANAIYFSDRWGWEFDPEQTKEDVFHAPDGDSSAFYMLREGDSLVYYEDNIVQSIRLSFKTGGSMYIILPKDNDATGFLASMTGEYFDEIRQDSILASGKLLLPRFSFESGVMQLDDTLMMLGVPLFDADAAPLTGGLVEEVIPMWLSGAVQKAIIEVDEKGTTAAAVTILPAPGAGMPVPTEPFEIICNRPFVFVLCSHTYDGGEQVLFTGVVNRP